MPKSAYSSMARPPLKPITWVGSARADLKACPPEVQDVLGFALYQAQLGGTYLAAKRLKGDLGGLVELVDDFDGNTYRAVYTAKLAGVCTCCTSSRRNRRVGPRRRNTSSI